MSSPKTHCPLCDKPWDICTCQNNPMYNAEAANNLLKALHTFPNEDFICPECNNHIDYCTCEKDEDCNKCHDCAKKKGKPCIED